MADPQPAAHDPLAWVADGLAALDRAGLRRVVRHRERPWSHQGLVEVSSNDYLGLARDPRLAEAARRHGVWGAGAGASRLIVGGSTPHERLEAEIAAWKGTQDAVVFSSGYLANVGTIQALVGRGDLVASDELNHASIIDGCRLSGAEVVVYRHGDADHLAALLADRAPREGRTLVVTDGVFSMDGDVADLPALCDVAEQVGAMVMVDDAHGSGVLGPDGRGVAAMQGVADRVHVHMATLSKAFGAAGGYVAGRADLVDWLRNRARSFVFDTAPPPTVIGAAREGLRLARTEPERRERALRHARRLAEGLDLPAPAACVVPLMIGAPADAMRLMEGLAEDGYLVVAIRPPTVPDGTARLRFSTSAALTTDEVEGLIRAVRGRW